MKKSISLLLLAFLLIGNQIAAGNNPFKEKLDFSKKEMPLRYKAPFGEEDGIKNKFLISAGAGFNIWGGLITLRYISSNYWENRNYQSIIPNGNPMLNASVDYGVLKNFSVGLAFGYRHLQAHPSSRLWLALNQR